MNASIIIPVYNSANILPTLVNELRRNMLSNSMRFEIILINDFSPDKSWEVIVSLSESFAEVRGLNLRKNTGQHNAIMAGLNHASGNVIVIMDDDLQHSPADVPRLYEMILQGYDVCYAQFGHVHHALWKRLGSAFNDRVASILLDKPSGIYLSSFKALSAGLRDEIVKYTGPYAYIDGLVLMTTSNIAVIESDHNERFEGKGNYSLSKSIGLWAKMATSFSILPLRLSGIIGILMAFAGFLIAAVAVFLRLFTDLPIPLGWTSLLVSGIVIGGTQLVALWMIGEYLGRAYVRSNNIPQYSIKDYRNIDPDMASAIRSHTEK